jgi:hypothetical protein
MPVLDVSFLNSKLRKSTSGGPSAGIMADELTILEDTLAKDGVLTTGDYDLLVQKAREIQNRGNMTPAQRSNFEVKISGYERAKSVTGLNRYDDIQAGQRMLQNEAAEDVMNVGSDPSKFLEGRIASLRYYLNDLADTIDRRGEAGTDEAGRPMYDSSQHKIEYNEMLRQYEAYVSALESGRAWQPGAGPLQGFAAYVQTNNRGEIVNVEYAPQDGRNGYAETNAVIGGFQVFGKSSKQNGRQMFKLGNDSYSAPDMMSPDPNNPGSFLPPRLVNEKSQRGGAFKTGGAGFTEYTSNTVPVQTGIPRGSWARDTTGTVFYRNEDGSYVKHVNASEEAPNRPRLSEMLVLPNDYSESVGNWSRETVDDTAPIMPAGSGDIMFGPPSPQQSMNPGGMNGMGPAPYGPPAPPGFSASGTTTEVGAPPAGGAPQGPTSRTKSPTSRAPRTVAGTAAETARAGVNFVRNAFS